MLDEEDRTRVFRSGELKLSVLIAFDHLGLLEPTIAVALKDPDFRALAATRDGVIQSLRTELSRRMTQGDIVFVDVPQLGVSSFGGIFRDDPDLDEIRDEAYRQRDAERPE